MLTFHHPISLRSVNTTLLMKNAMLRKKRLEYIVGKLSAII